VSQPDAAIAARNMYNSSYVESDLINSYSWDTAIVFIQHYSGNSNYAKQVRLSSEISNTGRVGDKVCNIHDMASNREEWTTEHSTSSGGFNGPYVIRGGYYRGYASTSSRAGLSANIGNSNDNSFRTLIVVK
jgi:hypothetical protein